MKNPSAIPATQAAGECFLHFSSVLKCWSVLSQSNKGLRLLDLLYDIEVMCGVSMFYILIKHGFLTNQSACTVLSIL